MTIQLSDVPLQWVPLLCVEISAITLKEEDETTLKI
jgi:hypothetical protein